MLLVGSYSACKDVKITLNEWTMLGEVEEMEPQVIRIHELILDIDVLER
jgi:hypothetical protein